VPGKLHTLIASLPIKCVITTNYDRLMELAFQIGGKQPQVATYDINGVPSNRNVTTVTMILSGVDLNRWPRVSCARPLNQRLASGRV
jgi:hypothetical protein